MTQSSINKLISAGILVPLVIFVWGMFSSNPYLVIGVSLIAIVLSFLLVFTGTILGGINFARSKGALRTRDLVFLAIGANVLLLMSAVILVIMGKNA